MSDDNEKCGEFTFPFQLCLIQLEQICKAAVMDTTENDQHWGNRDLSRWREFCQFKKEHEFILY